MFRSLMTIIRELYLYLTKAIFMLKQDQELASRIRTFHPDPARKLCDIYHCCVYSEKLLMKDRGTVRNM